MEKRETQSSPLQELRVPVHDGVAYVAQTKIPTTRNPEQNGNDGAAYEPPNDDDLYALPSSRFASANIEKLNQASKRRCNDSDAGYEADNRKSRRTSRHCETEALPDALTQLANIIENGNREERESSDTSAPVPVLTERRGSLSSMSGELASPGLGFQVLRIGNAGSSSPELLPSGPTLGGRSPPLPPPERRGSNISLPSFSELEAYSLSPLPPQPRPASDASPPLLVRRGAGPPPSAVAWGPGQPLPPAQRKGSTLALTLGENPAPIPNDINWSEPLDVDDVSGGDTVRVHGPAELPSGPITRNPGDEPLYYTGQGSYAGKPRSGYIPGVTSAGGYSPESPSPPSLMSLASVLSSLPPSPHHSSSLSHPPQHDNPPPEPPATPPQVPTSQEITKLVSAAIRYSTKSWWNDLQDLEVQEVRNLTARFGRKHPDTLDALGALATLYTTAGKDTEAKELHEYVYDQLRKFFGPTHPRTVTAQHNLADVCLAKGDYPVALAMAKGAAEHSKTVYGADHAETLSSLVLLGHVLSRLGGLDEAMRIANRVVETQRRKPEAVANRHTTLSAKRLLGTLLEKKGRYQQARAILEEVLARQEELFGKGHPETLSVMDSLGTVYLSLGEPRESEEILRRTVHLSTEKLGGKHPDTLSSKHNLVCALLKNGQFAAAKDLAGEVYAETRQVLGDEHLDTALSMANQASALAGLGDVSSAIGILRTTLDKLALILPAGSSQVLFIKEKLARELMNSFRFFEAERVMRQVLVERGCALGYAHPETVRVEEWLHMCRARMREAEVKRQGRESTATAAGGLWTLQEGLPEGTVAECSVGA